MKNLATIILISISTLSFSQEVSAKFAGDWEGKCLLEKVENTLSACGICHFAFSKDSNSIEIKNFDLNFMDGNMTFTFPDGKEVVPFRYNEKTEHMFFELEGRQYDFAVIYIESLSKVILKSKEGNLVYLERKNSMR